MGWRKRVLVTLPLCFIAHLGKAGEKECWEACQAAFSPFYVLMKLFTTPPSNTWLAGAMAGILMFPF